MFLHPRGMPASRGGSATVDPLPGCEFRCNGIPVMSLRSTTGCRMECLLSPRGSIEVAFVVFHAGFFQESDEFLAE